MTLPQYREALRTFLKDRQELNRLLQFEEESRNEDLDLYLNMSLGFMNLIPPPIQVFSLANFPIPALLIHQAAIEALISNGVVQSRNDLTYNNGGVTVKTSDGDRYLSILQALYKRADRGIEFLSKYKVSLNVNAGWGGSASPYANIAQGGSASLNPNTLF